MVKFVALWIHGTKNYKVKGQGVLRNDNAVESGIIEASGIPVHGRTARCDMHIPENIRIPVIVFGLQAALLAGAALVFLILVPD